MVKLDPNNKSDLDLARRIACAFISHQMDVSYQTLWKNHNYSTATPGPIWFEIAEQAIEIFRNSKNELAGE